MKTYFKYVWDFMVSKIGDAAGPMFIYLFTALFVRMLMNIPFEFGFLIFAIIFGVFLIWALPSFIVGTFKFFKENKKVKG